MIKSISIYPRSGRLIDSFYISCLINRIIEQFLLHFACFAKSGHITFFGKSEVTCLTLSFSDSV